VAQPKRYFAWPREERIATFAGLVLIGYNINEVLIMYYVYLLECGDDKSWYIGYTEDLKKRLSEHQGGSGCFTTSKKKNWKLIYYEAYPSKYDALGREKFLKGGSGRKYLKKQLKNYLDNVRI